MFRTKLILPILMVVAVTLSRAQYEFESEHKTKSIETFIVKGRNATRGQFPFYVYLQVVLPLPDGSTFCGASLISDQWIVTAAHCVLGASSLTVHLGSLRARDTKEKGRKIYSINLTDIYVHPKYSKFLIRNDIALVKLPKPVEFSDIIKPIPFACTRISGGTGVTAIGNGFTNDDSDRKIPPILQYTELKTMSWFSCTIKWPYLIFRRSVICVRSKELHSTCFGDSGGPLVTNDNTLIGASSFIGWKGCESGYPQVFTRISYYQKWIKDISGVECKN